MQLPIFLSNIGLPAYPMISRPHSFQQVSQPMNLGSGKDVMIRAWEKSLLSENNYYKPLGGMELGTRKE